MSVEPFSRGKATEREGSRASFSRAESLTADPSDGQGLGTPSPPVAFGIRRKAPCVGIARSALAGDLHGTPLTIASSPPARLSESGTERGEKSAGTAEHGHGELRRSGGARLHRVTRETLHKHALVTFAGCRLVRTLFAFDTTGDLHDSPVAVFSIQDAPSVTDLLRASPSGTLPEDVVCWVGARAVEALRELRDVAGLSFGNVRPSQLLFVDAAMLVKKVGDRIEPRRIVPKPGGSTPRDPRVVLRDLSCAVVLRGPCAFQGNAMAMSRFFASSGVSERFKSPLLHEAHVRAVGRGGSPAALNPCVLDLHSLAFTLLHLLNGGLPWQHLAKKSDKKAKRGKARGPDRALPLKMRWMSDPFGGAPRLRRAFEGILSLPGAGSECAAGWRPPFETIIRVLDEPSHGFAGHPTSPAE